MEPVDLNSSKTVSVDLNDEADGGGAGGSASGSAGTLHVDISDALSERDWVKFTVHAKSTMPEFAKSEFSVIRLHEEFLWLHDTFTDNPDYAGFIIPPAPPRPDFDASREKLRRLGDAESTLTKEEFNKLKQELEAEYLATFKKTVAMHETFLCRLAQHPVFRSDRNLHIFLEYEDELNVRGKNKKERLAGFLSSFTKTGDELLLNSTVKEVDDFFDAEKHFLVEYHNQLRDCTLRADKMTSGHRNLAEVYIKISQAIVDLEGGGCGGLENKDEAAASAAAAASSSDNGTAAEMSSINADFLLKVSDAFEKMRRIEGRVASDQDLKLSDTLRYHCRDTAAAKDLLYRRLKCLSNYEAANKNLDRARTKNRDVNLAENQQMEACQRFEQISAKAKEELKTLRSRRVGAFHKTLTELAELELKHSKAHAQMLRSAIASLQAEL